MHTIALTLCQGPTLNAGLVILHQCYMLIGEPPDRRPELHLNTGTHLTLPVQEIIKAEAEVYPGEEQNLHLLLYFITSMRVILCSQIFYSPIWHQLTISLLIFLPSPAVSSTSFSYYSPVSKSLFHKFWTALSLPFYSVLWVLEKGVYSYNINKFFQCVSYWMSVSFPYLFIHFNLFSSPRRLHISDFVIQF